MEEENKQPSEKMSTEENVAEENMTEESTSKESMVEESAPEAQPGAEGEDEAVEVPEKFRKIVEEIEQMSVMDLNELVKVFEKKFGVSAAAVAAAPAAAAAEDEGGGGLVSVTLEDGGASKIQVIKVVKEVLGLGLKEAKEFVDAAPKVVKEGMSSEDAEELKKQLEEVGAKVTVA